MRVQSAFSLVGIVALTSTGSPVVHKRAVAPDIQANSNTRRAGVLRDGVLTVTLEAKPSLWFLNGPKHPAMTIEAFSEPGKPPLMPAPLLRVTAGTELRVTIRNSLSRRLTFLVPAALHGAPFRMTAMDSVAVDRAASAR